MFVETLLILATFITLITAMNQRHHILMMILSLEATSLTFALLFGMKYSPIAEDYMSIIILTFAAAETAAALALLATLTRVIGTDSMSSCSFSMFK